MFLLFQADHGEDGELVLAKDEGKEVLEVCVLESTCNLLFFNLFHLVTSFSKSRSFSARPFSVICNSASTLLVVNRFLRVVLVRFIALNPRSHSALLTGRDSAYPAILDKVRYARES